MQERLFNLLKPPSLSFNSYYERMPQHEAISCFPLLLGEVVCLSSVLLVPPGRSSPWHRNPHRFPVDLKLPQVNGLEVVRCVKADPRARMIPIVALTSSRQERDPIESYRLGANSYIVKPVDFEQFLESARQLGLYGLLLNQSPPGA